MTALGHTGQVSSTLLVEHKQRDGRHGIGHRQQSMICHASQARVYRMTESLGDAKGKKRYPKHRAQGGELFGVMFVCRLYKYISYVKYTSLAVKCFFMHFLYVCANNAPRFLPHVTSIKCVGQPSINAYLEPYDCNTPACNGIIHILNNKYQQQAWHCAASSARKTHLVPRHTHDSKYILHTSSTTLGA